MIRHAIRYRCARWLALLLTLSSVPFGAFAQSPTAPYDPDVLAAKLTALAAAPLPDNEGVLKGRLLKSTDPPGYTDDAGRQLMGALQPLMGSAARQVEDHKYRLTAVQEHNLAALSLIQPDGGQVKACFNPATGTPTFLKLKVPQKASALRAFTVTAAHDTAQAFLRENQDLLALRDPDGELSLKRQWQGPLGNRHLRYQQKVAGIPVWGREAYVHVDGQQAVYLYQGYTGPTPATDPDRTPGITAAEAILAAEAHLGTASAEDLPFAELAFYPEEDGRLILCYQVDLLAGPGSHWWYFIDALDGSFVHRVSQVHQEVVRGSGTDLQGVTRSFNAWYDGTTYYLVDPTVPLDDPPYDPVPATKPLGNLYIFDAEHTQTSGQKLSNSALNAGWDSAGVSAMHHVTQVYNYYKNTFNRNGIDDNGMNYQVVVHAVELVEEDNIINIIHDTAYWSNPWLAFGDGEWLFNNMAGGLDIIAHETQHGVTEFTANLKYENQSGALNEAYSDIFACMVDRDDWTVGEDVVKVDPYLLRDLAHPERGLDPLPTTMREYVNEPNTQDGDWGGVHTNMSIPSRAAYLIAEGLTTEGLGTAIGRSKTEQIFYRALTTYLLASSNFEAGRNATIQAAEDLYGADSAEVAAVKAGWDAVGVEDAGGGVPSDPSPTPADPLAGQDLMAYLAPIDGTYDDTTENFDVYVQTLPSPFTGFDPSQVSSDLNRAQFAKLTRPAVYTANGQSFILFIGKDANVYKVSADGASEEQITTTGTIWSVAVSPSGDYFAYTTTSPNDNHLYVGDTASGAVTAHEIITPSTQHPDAGDVAVFSTILYADALAFDYTGRRIVFDALNCIAIDDSSCANNGGYRYWTIAVLDIEDGTFFFPFPNQNPNYDLAYPAFAANNDFIIAMDVIDNSRRDVDGTVISTVQIFNSNDNSIHIVARPNMGSANRTIYGVPSFWGDDDYLTAQHVDDTNGTALRVALDDDWAGDPATAEQITTRPAAMPSMHRAGTRTLSAVLTLSSNRLDFGSLDPGGSADREVTLTNNSERDIEITAIGCSSTSFTHNGANTLLPRGSDMTITVTYTAADTAGNANGTLTITSDANPTNANVALLGISNGSSNDDDGGGGGGGGCFMQTLTIANLQN